MLLQASHIHTLYGLKNASACEVVVRSYWKDSDLKPHYSAWSAKKKIALTEKRKVLVIGDSRSYHMSRFGGSNASKFVWLAEGAVGVDFIRPSYQNGHYKFYVTLGQKLPNALVNNLTGVTTKGYTLELAAQMKAQGITTVIYALGVNTLISDQGTSSAITYAVDTMKRLQQETGCEVFFMTALPCNDARAAYYGYQMTDARVRTYNATVKSKCAAAGISTIDAYSTVSSANTKEDGIHYRSDVCTSVVNMLNRLMF